MRTPWLIFGVVCSLACGVGAFGCGGNNDKSKNPQCSDGIDNDGDGLVDFPDDPGCVSADDETENSLPSPQCSDGRDNDGDGKTDFPDDPGCTSASDNDEFTDNPAACGTDTIAQQLPFDGHVMGMIDPAAISHLSSTTCGGGGGEQVYELRIMSPKVVTAT